MVVDETATPLIVLVSLKDRFENPIASVRHAGEALDPLHASAHDACNSGGDNDDVPDHAEDANIDLNNRANALAAPAGHSVIRWPGFTTRLSCLYCGNDCSDYRIRAKVQKNNRSNGWETFQKSYAQVAMSCRGRQRVGGRRVKRRSVTSFELAGATKNC